MKLFFADNENPCQQVFILNKSFQLDQVILELNNDVQALIGRSRNEDNIANLLKDIDRIIAECEPIQDENFDDDMLSAEVGRLRADLDGIYANSC